MSEKIPHNDQLENYLLGKLSAAEKAAMDAQLSADSQLHDDMLLQRDIVDALQQERRLELKNRLNNIEVGVGSGMNTALGLKIAAGLAIIGLVGTGIFFYSQDTPLEESGLPIGVIELPIDNPTIGEALPATPEATYLYNTIEENKNSETNSEQATEEIVSVLPKKNSKTTLPAFSREEALAKAKSEGSKPKALPEIVVQKPNIVSEFKDTDLGSGAQQAETPVDAMAKNRQFSTQSIEVTAQQHAKYDFHYQFSDNKLFIYGDFKSKPYEILEINNEGNTSYYLFFENSYYGLKSNQEKLSRLRKLTNEKLIKELEITRTQKVNTHNN